MIDLEFKALDHMLFKNLFYYKILVLIMEHANVIYF